MQGIKRVLLTGGGTAGHVNPALAIGSIFNDASIRFLFVGTRGRVEEDIVPREGIPIKFVRASGYPGIHSPAIAGFLFNLLIGSLQSLCILLRFRPQVIIGTGGYVSAPILVAASILKKLRLSRVRVFMHEQNAVPGKLNRVMGRFADTVFVTFPETLNYFPTKGVIVGYPLRKSISRTTREEALRKIDFKIPEGRKVVLVFGGSQGSRNINRALVDSLQYLLPYRHSIFIIHGTGLSNNKNYNAAEDTEKRLQRIFSKEQLREIESFYTHKPFFYHIENLYAVCDVVVARAGAGSLNEISAMELPALIIPKSNLPGNHQVLNARSMEQAGAIGILYEQIELRQNTLTELIDGKMLAEKLLHMLADNGGLEQMRQRCRSFFNRDALLRIEKHIEGGQTIESRADQAMTSSFESNLLPNNLALVSLLEKESAKQRHYYRPELVIPRPQDLEYLKNRACTLLVHSSWQNRNLGIKLLGLLGAKEKIPVMLALLTERKPVSRFKKILGGDFEQVGFIRRNIFTALMRLNELSPEVEEALLAGLEDPYYEVRAQAAHAVAFFGPGIRSTGTIIPALEKLLEDPSIDVVVAAADALGNIGGEHDALPALLSMWDSRLWKVRAAVLRGIVHLVRRGVIQNHATIEEQAGKFILTSTDFRPHFEIKAVYRHLMELISKEKEKRMEP
jgi:UDP-N-acetylglucosamine--N-acetylmuramyl-(pentapeptide) pyrophosphoryl-undecaprenol N-acetylglucosamine transferase